MNDVRTVEVTPDAWQVWREMRLRSLREDPDAFGSAHDVEAEFDEHLWRSRLDGTSGPSVLAFNGDEPVGMGAGWLYQAGRLMVVAMWSDPNWRGRGVGREVLDQVVGWGRARGLQSDLWVADVNPSARRLYERYGFRGTGESEPLREGSPITKSRLVLPD